MSIQLQLPGQGPEEAAATSLRNWSMARGREVTFEELSRDNYVGTVQETIDLMGALEDAGTEYVIVYLNDLARGETMRLFAKEVMPHFA
jgi:hypothetical protein